MNRSGGTLAEKMRSPGKESGAFCGSRTRYWGMKI